MDQDEPSVTSVTVIERDPERTGLLDQHGRPLVRQMRPLGFDLTKAASRPFRTPAGKP